MHANNYCYQIRNIVRTVFKSLAWVAGQNCRIVLLYLITIELYIYIFQWQNLPNVFEALNISVYFQIRTILIMRKRSSLKNMLKTSKFFHSNLYLEE